MNHHFFDSISTLAIGVMALFFVIVGLRGIITRKPFLFSSRILFAFFVTAIAPNFLLPLVNYGHVQPRSFELKDLILPAMFALILVVWWIQTRGYMIYGIGADTFRNCLHRSLEKLNLPFQESFSSIRLETIDANLQASVQDWMGTVQLRIKPARHANTLNAIAGGLREEFLTETVRVNMQVFVIYILLGLMTLAFAILLATVH